MVFRCEVGSVSSQSDVNSVCREERSALLGGAGVQVICSRLKPSWAKMHGQLTQVFNFSSFFLYRESHFKTPSGDSMHIK